MTKKTLTTALRFGAPWTFMMMIYYSIVNGGLTTWIVFSTLIGGVVAGVLYAIIMQYVAGRLYKSVIIETDEDERIIKQAGANYFIGKEGVGGKLVLTDRRLMFKPHKFNVQKQQAEFQLTEIERLELARTLRFMRNGLSLETAGRGVHKFIVDEPHSWMETILQQKRDVN